MLATNALGKDEFDGNPFALDIAGTFSSNLAREFFAESHLVVSTGPARNFTTEGGHLYPNAKVAQIDTKPRELPDAPRTAISISEPMLAPRPKRSQGS